MRTVRERITVSTARRVQRFIDTRTARDRVRYHAGARTATCTRDNPEAARGRCLVECMAFDGIDTPKWRTTAAQALGKIIERTCVRPCVDQYTLAVVAYIAAYSASVRKTPYCGPETHALHQSAHTNIASDILHVRRNANNQPGQ